MQLLASVTLLSVGDAALGNGTAFVTALGATALGGRAAHSRVGSRWQVCLLSLPGVRVLTLPPFDLANLAARSLRQGCRCQVAPGNANGALLL